MSRREFCSLCDHCRLNAAHAPGGVTDTSVRAAERLRASLSKTEDRIMEYLNAAKGPMTCNRISELSGIPLHTVRPRLTYLKRVGKVNDSGQRFHISEHNTAIAWEPVQP